MPKASTLGTHKFNRNFTKFDAPLKVAVKSLHEGSPVKCSAAECRQVSSESVSSSDQCSVGKITEKVSAVSKQ
jgi:hypothetical protein